MTAKAHANTLMEPLLTSYEERQAFVITGCHVENAITVGITLMEVPPYSIYREHFEPIEDEL